MRSNVTLTLPGPVLAELDDYARERGLPRSYAAQEIFEHSLRAGRAQPQETREHARLSNTQQESSDA